MSAAVARLTEIRERVEKATPGPWDTCTSSELAFRNAEFLSHALDEDIPFLLAEVDRLAARVKELEGALRPFASVDFDADEDAGDAITRADFRAARAALQPEEEGR